MVLSTFGITFILSERRKFSYYCIDIRRVGDSKITARVEVNSLKERNEIREYMKDLGFTGVRKRTGESWRDKPPKDRQWYTRETLENTATCDCDLIFSGLSDEEYGRFKECLRGLFSLGYRELYFRYDPDYVVFR